MLPCIATRRDSRVASSGSSRSVAAEAKACESMSSYFLTEIKSSPMRNQHIAGGCRECSQMRWDLRRSDSIGTFVLPVQGPLLLGASPQIRSFPLHVFRL